MNAVKTATPTDFFIAGGALRQDAASYVERQADNDLYAALRRGEYCYVLTARQMGKSSLMSRTAARLQAAGISVAALDLTAIGQNLTDERWYAGLMVQTGDRLGLGDELIDFWRTNQLLGPMQRWIKAIRTVVLPKCSGPLVISIDEIDAVLSLPFSTDEFFAGIRECYNLRSIAPEMEKLTFCLLGVATPADLIRDTRTTPFNIGRRIELQDFTADEASPLAYGLGHKGREGLSVLRRILYWTGGHPYMTQRMCQAATEGELIRDDSGVDHLCENLFITPHAQERDENLLFVRERLVRGSADVGGLLELYDKVRRGRPVRDNGTDPRVGSLRLSGVTKASNGRLLVRNRVYARIFNKAWIEANMPDAELQRQRAAFRRGVWRTALVSLAIIAIIGWLALLAFKQAVANRRLLYFAQMKVAQQEWENANTDRVVEILAPYTDQKDLRGFEWQILWNLTHSEKFRLNESRPVVGVTLLDNGQTLAVGETIRAKPVGGDEYYIKLYDFKAEREIVSYAVPAGKNFDVAAFSPDTRYVAVDSPNNEVVLFDLRSGRQVNSFAGHKGAITSITFSPDGHLLAVGDVNGNICLKEISTGSEKVIISEYPDWARCISFSPDGRLLAAADNSHSVRFWKVATGISLPPFEISDASLVRTWFFPDGSKILIAAKDGRIFFWDLHSRTVVKELSGHAGEITSATFSHDGKMLATGSANRTVKLWNAETGQEMATIRGHGSAVKAIAWSADDSYLFTGSLDGSVKMWSVAEATEPVLPTPAASKFLATAFTPARDLIALGVSRDRRVKLWNLSTGQELATFDEDVSDILCAAFSQNNQLLAINGKDNQIRIWETSSGRLARTLTGHGQYVQSVDFSPDGKLLVSGGQDQSLRLWNIESGREIGQLLGGKENYYRAVFSPDGKWIASACRDGDVKLWDVDTRTIIKTFIGHRDRVRAIAFSQDGQRLATGGKDNTIRIWDTKIGRELMSLGRSDAIQRAAFSADGRRLVTGGMDGTVKLWDVMMQQELVTLKGHADAVTSVTFSSSALDLATSGADGTVRLWRAERHK